MNNLSIIFYITTFVVIIISRFLYDIEIKKMTDEQKLILLKEFKIIHLIPLFLMHLLIIIAININLKFIKLLFIVILLEISYLITYEKFRYERLKKSSFDNSHIKKNIIYSSLSLGAFIFILFVFYLI